jgi:hypothetical protein
MKRATSLADAKVPKNRGNPAIYLAKDFSSAHGATTGAASTQQFGDRFDPQN